MTDNDTRPQDPDMAAELEGVPSELTEGGDALGELGEASSLYPVDAAGQ